jgi:hypothetical protein
MSIIDDQGRLFGRFNLIDALVVGAIVVLAPIAYSGYQLFRPAPITIETVEPARVVLSTPGAPDMRVRITGKNLRPYLSAQLGHEQIHKFLIQTPSIAEFEAPRLPPGVYDLSLFDETELLTVKKNAITIVAPELLPPVTVRLAGAFVGLEPEAAKSLAAGQHLGAVEILSVGAASDDVRRVLLGSSGTQYVQTVVAGRVRVPAVLRASCSVEEAEQRCKINGGGVAPGQMLSFDGKLFSIDEIRSDVPEREVDLVVQFVGQPDLIDQIRAGDRDSVHAGSGASVLSLGRRESMQGQVATHFSGPGPERTLTRSEALASIDATLRVTAVDGPSGLEFEGAALKTGAPFVLQTPRYIANGTILRATPKPSSNDSH